MKRITITIDKEIEQILYDIKQKLYVFDNTSKLIRKTLKAYWKVKIKEKLSENKEVDKSNAFKKLERLSRNRSEVPNDVESYIRTLRDKK